MQSRVKMGTRLVQIHVTNDLLGGDPVHGVPKTLRVMYTVDGGASQQQAAAEWSVLVIRAT